MKLPVLSADKANHVIYGAVVALIVLAITGKPLAALAAAAVVGAVKEVADRIANKRAGQPVHGVELGDLVATAAGGAIVAVAAFVNNQGGVWQT